MDDICIIGPLTRDRIYQGGRLVREGVGGVPYYAGITAAAQGARVGVVTWLAAADRSELLAPLHAAKISVQFSLTGATHTFENHLTSDATTERRQRVTSIAEIDLMAILKTLPLARCYLLGPLLQTDISLGFVQRLRQRNQNACMALDVQGVLRSNHQQEVIAADPTALRQILDQFDTLKFSAAEADKFFPGMPNEIAAKQLNANTARDVIITKGNKNTCIATANGIFHVAAQSVGLARETTGCGDIFFAAYLYRRLCGDSEMTAASIAALLAGKRAAHSQAWHEIITSC